MTYQQKLIKDIGKTFPIVIQLRLDGEKRYFRIHSVEGDGQILVGQFNIHETRDWRAEIEVVNVDFISSYCVLPWGRE